ncbi:hypothetical protein CCHL11_06323 [Colletotrichum chlorophyti]|uniref:Uncharacterized protein n=1 Tax=Colletotrichum chlorophyti TaxID=708187 RepID=A0A1Q8RLC5_9PEZI|nr:hypothetical protein CCHL11_06323 [Colletotrichum chlorophyti]
MHSMRRLFAIWPTIDTASNDVPESPAVHVAPGSCTAINAPKRPLTPTYTSVTVSLAKRSAVAAPEGRAAFFHNYPESSITIGTETENQYPLPGLTRTPPSPSGEEVPETLSFDRFSLGHSTVAGVEDPDSWMSQFVDLDNAPDGFVLATKGPNIYHDAASEGWLNTQKAISKPFPELNLEILGKGPHIDHKHRSEESPSKVDTPIGDDYYLDDAEEEEMLLLLEQGGDKPPCVPPSSVVHHMDGASRSTTTLDSNVCFSSPGASSLQSSKVDLVEPDLLDDDVDWDIVTACAQNATPTPVAKSGFSDFPRPATSSIPAPFVRPPFPTKTRDRSMVVGLSSKTMMRTCFRIGELLNAHTQSVRDKQDIVVELFARVSYSSRETITKTQHVQFWDLFTDRQPYLNGIFRGWKNGGPADGQSKTFLGPSGNNTLCRCICKLLYDKKATIGRSASILSIRETTWDEVHWALRIVTRDAVSEDGSNAVQTAPLAT